MYADEKRKKRLYHAKVHVSGHGRINRARAASPLVSSPFKTNDDTWLLFLPKTYPMTAIIPLWPLIPLCLWLISLWPEIKVIITLAVETFGMERPSSIVEKHFGRKWIIREWWEGEEIPPFLFSFLSPSNTWKFPYVINSVLKNDVIYFNPGNHYTLPPTKREKKKTWTR